MRTFKQIVEDEKIDIHGINLGVAKRLQRLSPSRSVDFDLDENQLQ